MTLTNRQKRQLLELHLDGEVSPRERRAVDELLARDGESREYVEALREVREAVRMPFDEQARRVSFDGFFDRVMAKIDAEPAPLPAGTSAGGLAVRDAAIERLAAAQHDGERLSVADSDRVARYLASTPAAREGLDAIDRMGSLVRGTFEQAESRAGLGELWTRVDRATAPQPAVVAPAASAAAAPTPTTASRGVLVRLSDYIGGGRTVVASVLSAAAAVLIMLPMTRQQTAATPADTEPKPVIVNNYYLAPSSVESVEFEPGFYGTYQPADPSRDLAPVVWITPETTDDTPSEPLEVEYDADAGVPMGKPL